MAGSKFGGRLAGRRIRKSVSDFLKERSERLEMANKGVNTGTPIIFGAISPARAMKIEEASKFIGRIFRKTFHQMKGGKILERTSTGGVGGSTADFRTINRIRALSEVPKKIQQKVKTGK